MASVFERLGGSAGAPPPTPSTGGQFCTTIYNAMKIAHHRELNKVLWRVTANRISKPQASFPLNCPPRAGVGGGLHCKFGIFKKVTRLPQKALHESNSNHPGYNGHW